MGMFNTKCMSPVRLEGKTAIITGSNTGIGKITAQDFFKRGAKVIMACRSTDKANEAAEEIKDACQSQENVGKLQIVHLDLTNLESVKNCAKKLLETEERIDLLVNNAGVMVCPQGKTKDGFETQFGTNHLGHFLFTLLLLPKLVESRPSRIINLTSRAYIHGHINFEDLQFEKRPYSAVQAYCQSKLANILFTKELARRTHEAGIEDLTVYSVHPGVVSTELGRHINDTYFWGLRMIIKILAGPFMKTPEEGAQTTIYCAVDENVSKETGLYYANCKVKEVTLKENSEEDAKKLWDVSLKLVGLDEQYNPLSKTK